MDIWEPEALLAPITGAFADVFSGGIHLGFILFVPGGEDIGLLDVECPHRLTARIVDVELHGGIADHG